jgi:gliding motility-associated-like protein
MKKIFISLFCLLIFGGIQVKAQTHTISYNVDWHTHDQNMWGPNGNVFTMDTNINLFDVDEADNVTAGYITNIFGGDFGAAINIDYWLKMGLNFTIEGFTTGSVDLNYPTEINLTLPDDYTWNPGQTITVGSDYNVLPGWSLDSHFPSSGSISLDLYFGFNIDVDATVCVWSCTTFDVFEVGVPLDTTILFEISDTNGVASATYPWYDPAIGFYFAHDTILPIIFNNLGGIGLSGIINLPYVATNDYMVAGDKCLYAKGDSAYIHLDLDILQFLSAFDPDLASIISMLNGTIDIGAGITLDYSLLTMDLLAESYMVQDYTFCPKIWAHLSFPMNLNYTETDPANGNVVVGAGNNDTMVFQVDHNLNVTFPCSGPPNYPIGVYFSMDNDFRNHTWDSIAFTFVLTAFTFTLNLPSFPVIPDVCLPEYCIAVPIPCNDKSGNPVICYDTICISSICTGPVTLPPPTDPSYTIGPLIDLSIPLGYVPLTWFDETWELAGFQPNLTGIFDTVVPGTMITPNAPMTTIIDGPNVICYGDTTAVITVIVTNGTAPFTYVWSTGYTNTTNASSDSIVAGVGTYSCTVTDASGCTSTEQLTIYYVNPQMFSTLIKEDINCAGDSTGWIICFATGGSPGYTYLWSPYGGTNDTAVGLYHGTYTVTITDSVNCILVDSITLIELHPLPPVNFIAIPEEGCQPLVVNFDETSLFTGQTYDWHFGDGAIDSISDPVHIYDTMGIFDVWLTVVSIYGCDSTMYKPGLILVHPKPVADFYVNPTTVLATIDPTWTVLFTDNSTYAYDWLWDFDDPGSGTNSAVMPITSHSFSEEGIFTVTLYVTSEFGCMDTATNEVEIIDDILQFPNIFTPNNDGFNDFYEIKNVEKYPDNSLVIFNRWGAKVFEQYHYRNTWRGDGISDGVYYYIFDSGNGDKPVEGTLTILR